MYLLCRLLRTSPPASELHCSPGHSCCLEKGTFVPRDSHRSEKTVRSWFGFSCSRKWKLGSAFFIGASWTSGQYLSVYVCVHACVCVYACGWDILGTLLPWIFEVLQYPRSNSFLHHCCPAHGSLSRRVYPKPPQKLSRVECLRTYLFVIHLHLGHSYLYSAYCTHSLDLT